jgi:hypothetical protein
LFKTCLSFRRNFFFLWQVLLCTVFRQLLSALLKIFCFIIGCTVRNFRRHV